MKRVDWSDLQYFFALAEAGTLAAASEKVGASQATIWRRVRELQDSLGVSLFEKEQSGHVLSAAGLKVMAAIGEMAKDAEGLTVEFLSKEIELEGDVRVIAPEFVGSSLIAPSLPLLINKHPKLSIELLLGSPTNTLFDRHADIALLFEQTTPERFRLHSSYPIPFAVYASRDYIRKHGRPASIKALKGHSVVEFEPYSGHIAPRPWSERGKSNFAVPFRSNSPHARIAAVASGIGLGIFPTCLAKAWTALECVIEPEEVGNLELLMLVNKSMARDIRIKAIEAFLAAILGEHIIE
jgi:DNA-binding transcriptional LysR family regulator